MSSRTTRTSRRRGRLPFFLQYDLQKIYKTLTRSEFVLRLMKVDSPKTRQTERKERYENSAIRHRSDDAQFVHSDVRLISRQLGHDPRAAGGASGSGVGARG